MEGNAAEYFKLQLEYEDKYGENTIVLYQSGGFYEIYAYDVTECTTEDLRTDKAGNVWNESIGDADEICRILNCNRAERTKPHSIRVPHMMGFPVGAYDKNLKTLLCNGYAVVRVDQEKYVVKSPKTGKKKFKFRRFVVGVETPPTHVECIPDSAVNCHIIHVYIEYDNSNIRGNTVMENILASVGVAIIDTLSNRSKVCEFYSKHSDPIIYIQQLYAFILSHRPSELVVNIVNLPESLVNSYPKFISKELEFDRYERVMLEVNKVDKEYSKFEYQTECLNKLFQREENNIVKKRQGDIISHLNLEMMTYGRIAYIILMQWYEFHCPNALKTINPPDNKWLDENVRLVLAHNSLIQLDIIAQQNKVAVRSRRKGKKIDSLVSLLDQNETSLGRRLLYSLIHSPMVDVEEIESYYNMTESLMQDELYKTIGALLSKLPDMDRLNKKLLMSTIQPKELASLLNGYFTIGKVFSTIRKTKAEPLCDALLSGNDNATFRQLLYLIKTHVADIGILGKCNIVEMEDTTHELEYSENPFNDETYPDIAQTFITISELQSNLDLIVDHLNEFVTRGKIHYPKPIRNKKQDNRHQIRIITTNAKAKTLQSANVDKSICGKLEMETHSTTEKVVTSKVINKITDTIDEHCNNLAVTLYDTFMALVHCLLIPNASIFYAKLNASVAKLDVVHTYAKLAINYNYIRPKLDLDSEVSYISVKNLRHPIIERIIDGKYVTNDLIIKQNGLLIYGHNRVGKSSLIKAVALAVVMAQIGCYVAADMTYYPYNKIFTRLSAGDNILAAKSSFDTEMCELRAIRRQADNRSLVLGNEIACSTETLSGTGLSGSALIQFVKMGCGFMLASHVHNLVELPQVKAIPQDKLRVCHLAVTKDAATGLIVYDRKLTDGLGSRIYGVNVAESLMLDREFIDTANDIVRYLVNESNKVATKQSNYSPGLYMDKCYVCGSREDLHTHHIIPQREADNKKTVDGMHVHSLNNLMVLCEKCHHTTHSVNIKYKVLDTIEGTVIVRQ